MVKNEIQSLAARRAAALDTARAFRSLAERTEYRIENDEILCSCGALALQAEEAAETRFTR